MDKAQYESMTHTGNTRKQDMGALALAHPKPSQARSSHTGKPMRARMSKRAIAERVAKLLADDNIKRLLCRRIRGTDAYVRFQVAPIACRHRDQGTGPLCGCVWELATYNLHTEKLIGAKCYVSGHQRVLNARRVIAQFKRWYKGLGASHQDVVRMVEQLTSKLGAQRLDA